ncbi:Acetyltransferase (GNAT) family [Rubrobacter radiotolerans]|uniref:Acetyltransferase (GNAT) family n=1 Tax=Rubrobacter radiotolerans TaxID=42256 RepID=A0A023X1L5_RUBRA|nr:GNAT family N-acetyltransferase [Rubrobacter radiotolerans]AHY45954.1 Acetyltransferase (GNAT) family [Rubrobacter radiotolerans]MDX5893367.1 GNAT family N-acetyltransferase [Rubrobacter radiotolerans]SMC03584.1 Ribosomal protein S18 acetylase RimI [Rubrobacter radiotolerans DSM 5868]
MSGGGEVRVETAASGELRRALRPLEEALREGEPLPRAFVRGLEEAVEHGDLSVVVAYKEDEEDGYEPPRPVGVLTLAFRPSIALGGTFASIEDLYVEPESRAAGVGRALIEEAGSLCAARGVSYIEAQVESGEEGAEGFYSALGFEDEEGVRVVSRSLPFRAAEVEAEGRG